MGCEEGSTNSNCSKKQNFCSINGQAVSNNLNEASRTLTSITQNSTITTDDIQNQIYQVLVNIFNYGNRGTRNPLIRKDGTNTKITAADQRKDQFQDVAENDEILKKLYNDIVNIIPVADTNNTLSNQQVISKDVMDKLQTQINAYQLNSDRCNSCNTSCNTSCEAQSQDCGQSACGVGTMYYYSCGNNSSGGGKGWYAS